MNLLVHFFFPHQSNNHKAKVIQPSGLFVILSVFLLFQLFLGSFPRVAPRILGFAANISADEVIRLTNEKRAENGLSSLIHNPALSQAAQAKATDMINQDYWAHVSPSGTQPWKFFTEAGYRYKYAGENLARDFADPVSAVNAWMASSSHRENLLSAKYKEIGVAVVDGDMNGVDTTIIVQLFGAKFADSLPVQPVAAASITETTKSASPKPQVLPTPTPVAVVAKAGEPTKPEAIGPSSQSKILVSPFGATKSISMILIVTLLAVLIIDMFVVRRKRIARISARSFAQLAFFGMILAIMLIAKAGKIL